MVKGEKASVILLLMLKLPPERFFKIFHIIACGAAKRLDCTYDSLPFWKMTVNWLPTILDPLTFEPWLTKSLLTCLSM